MTTEAGKRLLGTFTFASPFTQDAYARDVAAIEAESAAQAVTAALADLETKVEGLEPVGDAGFYNAAWVGRKAVLTLIREARESLPGGGKS